MVVDLFMVYVIYDYKRVVLYFLKMYGVDKFNIGFVFVDLCGNLLLDLKNIGGWWVVFFIFGMRFLLLIILWNLDCVRMNIIILEIFIFCWFVGVL